MPELPEVETVRRDLVAQVGGKNIRAVEVMGARTVRRYGKDSLIERASGRTVSGARRHGKYLSIDLDNGDVIIVHLRMSGMLLWSSSTPEPADLRAHTHVRFMFDDGELHFVDPRTFGEIWVTDKAEPELSHLGPDAFNDLHDSTQLAAQFEGRKSALKIALVNQQVIAGIGNIYADEIAFVAKVRPERSVEGLSKQAIAKVFDATREVLTTAIEARGSSLADKQYVDLFGNIGNAQAGHRVYAREGQPCLVCGRPIVRLPIGARSAFSCRHCQR